MCKFKNLSCLGQLQGTKITLIVIFKSTLVVEQKMYSSLEFF